MDLKSSLNRKRQKTTTITSSRRKGKELIRSTPVALSTDLPIAMRLPQETLCQIFNNLVEHPVHFTRVAQVCKSWKVAADTHLYWRYLVNKMDLPPPKPRAWKYKTYKSVVEREWRNQNFCSLCFRKSNAIERLSIQKAIIDNYDIAKICTGENKYSDWYSIFNAEDDSHEFCAFEKYFVEYPNVLKKPIKLVEEITSKENFGMEIIDNSDLGDKSDLFGGSQLSDLSSLSASSSQDLTIFSQLTTTSDILPAAAPSIISSDESVSTIIPTAPKVILRHNLCRICNLRFNNKKMEREENERRSLLITKLGSHGLSLRSDSRLCNGFIEHGLGNPDRIVETMAEMNWFFKFTDYSDLKYVYTSHGGGYTSDEDDWEDDMFIDRYDMPWRHLFSRPRSILTKRIDSESGKRSALERWVEQRLSKGIHTSPSEDPESDQRPPSTLWEQINRIIDKKLSNGKQQSESFQRAEGSFRRQEGKIVQNNIDIIDLEALDEESDCWFDLI
jgi:hypothetical protein